MPSYEEFAQVRARAEAAEADRDRLLVELGAARNILAIVAKERDALAAASVAERDQLAATLDLVEQAAETLTDNSLRPAIRSLVRRHRVASGSTLRAQAPAVEGAASVIGPAVTVPVERPVDLHFGLRPGDDRVRLADLDMTDGHSSAIGVSSRFARAAAGEQGGADWVRLRTGSGRQYEGYRSEACLGDGVPGHQHDIRCVQQDG